MKKIISTIVLGALIATTVAPVQAWPNRTYTRTITVQPNQRLIIRGSALTLIDENGKATRLDRFGKILDAIKVHPVSAGIVGATVAGLVAFNLYGKYVEDKLASENPIDKADVEKHNTFYSRILGLYKSRNIITAATGLTAAIAAATAYYFGK